MNSLLKNIRYGWARHSIKLTSHSLGVLNRTGDLRFQLIRINPLDLSRRLRSKSVVEKSYTICAYNIRDRVLLRPPQSQPLRHIIYPRKTLLSSILKEREHTPRYSLVPIFVVCGQVNFCNIRRISLFISNAKKYFRYYVLPLHIICPYIMYSSKPTSK